MRVLLRQHEGKYYVWKDAEWQNDSYYILDDNGEKNEIGQVNIIAIENDPRVGMVQCIECGKLIENNPESIEAHYVEQENKRDCLKCEYLSFARDKKIIDCVGEKNIDGTYSVTQTVVSTLLCRRNYWSYEIDSTQAIHGCIYNQCRRNGVAPINDVFIQHPGLFETFITVDTLVEKKYEKEEYRCGLFEYDLKCRGALKACVNELGIVDCFRLIHRGSSCYLYYSDKYNLLLSDKYCRYDENICYNMSDSKLKQIKDKIAALYKEANK